jgi:exopolysaccharide biosynthesis polyprenyl glycosylphosphotransferase
VTRDESLEGTILLQDVLLLIGSLLLARLGHAGAVRLLPALKPPVAAGEYAYLLIVFLPTWVLAAERLGIHRVRTLTAPRLEAVRRLFITQGWGLAAIALILVGAQRQLNRSLIAIFFVLSTAVLLLAGAAQRRWIARRRGQSVALVVGDVPEALASDIQLLRGRQVERQGTGDAGQLGSRLRLGPVDEVVLVGPFVPEQTRSLLAFCADVGIPALVPVVEGAGDPGVFPPPSIETIGGTQYLVYQRRSVDALSLILKAVQDRVVAALLLALTLPLMLVLALLVRLFVGGPVIFVQRRGGLFGHSFPMLKLRTMRVGADRQRDALLPHNEMDGPVFKMTNDPRVTRFGRFLRRSSLDELPQLFNVLAGQMSLVGPRPLPLDETRALRGRYRRRLSVRPGLTCLWQINGRSDLTFEQWMALDLEYVDRWSLGLDAAILLRTLPAIVSGRGAR